MRYDLNYKRKFKDFSFVRNMQENFIFEFYKLKCKYFKKIFRLMDKLLIKDIIYF